MYDKEKERVKALQYAKSSTVKEVEFIKKENFKRAIQFALEETDEIEKALEKMLESVEHLEVFRAIFKPQLDDYMSKLLYNTRYMIEKNYTREEKDLMPEEVFRQVQATQQRRMDLLKKVAIRYLSSSN